ncbi:MAG: hypothetical protein U1B30_03800 [Pseudomonadota bacterium]|nr:hypothetical protein [Pseudomonadota bacterium]
MSTIDALPAGQDGPVITFNNDDPNGASPFRPVTTETAKMVEAAVIESGVDQVNINSTSGGGHSETSRHYQKKAVDINEVNGEKVLKQGSSPAVKDLQDAFSKEDNIRENFGPSENTKKTTPGGKENQVPSVAKQHRNHIHVSGQQ